LADRKTFAKILMYGKPKSGKTTAAAQVAKLDSVERVVYVDCESGLKAPPLINYFGVPVDKIDVHDEITDAAIEALMFECLTSPPDALVVDSATELHKKLLEEIANANRDRANAAGKNRDKYSMQVDDYGDNTTQMRKLFRGFRDAKAHVIFVALEQRDTDKATGLISYRPDMTPKLSSDLLGYVDIVCHTTCESVSGQAEPNYWGTFRAVDLYEGGDRFHMLPPRLINPSADRIIAYVNGDLTLDDDADMQREFARMGIDSTKAEELDAALAPPKTTTTAPPPLKGAKAMAS
jgi:hypothetical protein